MSNIRFRALEQIQNRKPVDPVGTDEILSIFGANVFTMEVMKRYLDPQAFSQLKRAILHGERLDRQVADSVANGMRVWSQERGVTHFTHWFQPLTGLTAEKHDAFLDMENGTPIERFSGSNLAQQEPDASSFPSGGIRNTFEARGYTAWDPSSPAFIFETVYGKTLCIPTIFVAYTGESLDYKAPLLKSISALDKAAVDVCHYFDRNVTKTWATLGAEQEYFLVDKAWADLRPDLALTGRTLVGATPARGQQLEDHYFGSIPDRVFAFMRELELESHKLGIPLKTRHNEVAPNQFECAPIFEEQNIAVDHNQLLVDLIDRVARKHNFRALLHEKPFAGVNGSGKHNNWSMGTDTGKNLLSPGKNPKDNLQFLTFFVNVIKAVHNHAEILRAVIASAANDHRLGANEAPPAIISVFVGTQLSKILEDLEKPSRKKNADTPKGFLKLGINKIPEILLDNTDRNRTSPFAFTGNKFEFRAVGSSANCSGPMTVLNTIVAHQLTEFKKTVDRKITRGKKKEAAILEVIRDYIKECKNIIFDGNGYSQEWVEEAARRGLKNIKTTPLSLDAYISEETKKLFASMNVLSEKEMEARHEIRLELYVKKVAIEVKVLEDLAMNHIFPAAIGYQNALLQVVSNLKGLGGDPALFGPQWEQAKAISLELANLKTRMNKLLAEFSKAHEATDTRAEAIYLADNVMPATLAVRQACDKLETLVADDYWPLPKYREMLFIR